MLCDELLMISEIAKASLQSDEYAILDMVPINSTNVASLIVE